MLRGIIRAAAVAIIFTSSWAAAAYAAADKRVALVIGNSAYLHLGALANPRNDAELIGSTLQHAGFEVISGIDLGKSAMREKIDEFTEAAFDAKVALIYYAGHGMQIDGQNYFIPVDSRIESVPQVRTQTISIETLMNALPPEPAVNILILDACRDNPLSRSLQVAVNRSGKGERGLANVQASQSNHGDGGLLIAFATDPDDVADDGKGTNSPYSTALARHLTEPGVELQSALTRVRAEVTQNTGGKQRPWANASLSREVFLGAEPAAMRGNAAQEQVPQQPVIVSGVSEQQMEREDEQTVWDEASKRNTIGLYEFYLKQYPNGRFVSLAVLNLDELKAAQPKEQPVELAAAPATDENQQQSAAVAEQTVPAQQHTALAEQQPAATQQQDKGGAQQLAMVQPVTGTSGTVSQTRAAAPVVVSDLMKQTAGTPETDAMIGLGYDRERAVDLQLRLNALSFDVGGIDGSIGRKSRVAIATWQGRLDMIGTGYLTMDQYNFLVNQTDPMMAGVRSRYQTQKAEAAAASARRAQERKQRVADHKRRQPEGRVERRNQSDTPDAFMQGLIGGVIGGVIGGALSK